MNVLPQMKSFLAALLWNLSRGAERLSQDRFFFFFIETRHVHIPQHINDPLFLISYLRLF